MFLSGTGGDQLHVMVADVIKSFDTVDQVYSGLYFGSSWACLTGFVKFIFPFHSQVRLEVQTCRWPW